MSDQLATNETECPCCKGKTYLEVYDLDGYTQIGNVACCYCLTTGKVRVESGYEEKAEPASGLQDEIGRLTAENNKLKRQLAELGSIDYQKIGRL